MLKKVKVLLFYALCWVLGAQQVQIIDLPPGNLNGWIGQQGMTVFNNKFFTVNAEGRVSVIDSITRSLERIIRPDDADVFADNLCVSEEAGVVLPSFAMYRQNPQDPKSGYVIDQATASVRFLDPQTGRVVHKISPSFVAINCAIRADGKIVVTSNLRGRDMRDDKHLKIAVLGGNLREGFRVESQWPTSASSIQSILCLKTNKCYFTAQYNREWLEVWVLNPSSGPVKIAELPTILSGDIVAEPGEKRLLFRTAKSEILVINTETDKFEEPISPWYFGRITFAGDPTLVYTWYTNSVFPVDLYLRKGIAGVSVFNEQENPSIKTVSAFRFPLFDLVAILRASSLVFVEVPRKPMVHAVLHGASFQPGPVSPGQWVTVFGSSLSFRSIVAPKTPLPTELEGTRVWLNIPGKPAQALPLLFASINQVNFQFPYDVPVGTKVKLVMEGPGPNQGIKSGTVELEVVSANPALFLMPDGNPILQRPNGSLTNSVLPGEHITLYATGLGQVQPPVVAGSPAPFNPLARIVGTVEVILDGTPCEVLFAGLSPGWVGLYQINIRIPPNVQPGKKPLLIKVKGEAAHSSYLINVGPS